MAYWSRKQDMSQLVVHRQGVVNMWTLIKKTWNSYWMIMEKGTGKMDL